MEYSDDFTYTTSEGLKVIFVGESGTGKTALIGYLCDQEFQKISLTTSVPVEQRISLQIESRKNKIYVSLWDTAGQEKFRCLNKLFFKDAKIAVIVFDITKRSTYEELCSFWYNYIKEVCGNNVVLAIAENKADLYETEQVSEEEVDEYAKQHQILHKRTSAKTGQGIQDLIKLACDKYVTLVDNGQIVMHRRSTFSMKQHKGSVQSKEEIQIETQNKTCCR